MSICSSNKTFYYNEEAAFEGLIDTLGSGYFAPNTGPVNVYKCEFCDGYHLTSKGEAHPRLTEPDIQTRISKLRQSKDWGY